MLHILINIIQVYTSNKENENIVYEIEASIKKLTNELRLTSSTSENTSDYIIKQQNLIIITNTLYILGLKCIYNNGYVKSHVFNINDIIKNFTKLEKEISNVASCNYNSLECYLSVFIRFLIQCHHCKKAKNMNSENIFSFENVKGLFITWSNYFFKCGDNFFNKDFEELNKYINDISNKLCLDQKKNQVIMNLSTEVNIAKNNIGKSFEVIETEQRG